MNANSNSFAGTFSLPSRRSILKCLLKVLRRSGMSLTCSLLFEICREKLKFLSLFQKERNPIFGSRGVGLFDL